jgi:ribulose-phosphate 3-epimerase
MKIYPAILTDSFVTAQEQLSSAAQADGIETVHIDVIDGNFVDNITLTPLDLTVAEFGELTIDFHLMTDEPMDFVYEAAGIKEYLPIRQMIGQVEHMSFQLQFVEEVKKNGWQAGLALNLFTPIEEVEEEVWSQIDTLLLLGVEAGAQHQEFQPHVLSKIKELAERDELKCQVVIDGGVKLENIAQLVDAGVKEFAIGSQIWDASDPVAMIQELLHKA